MKKNLLSIALIAITSFSYAQGGALWKTSIKKNGSTVFENKSLISNPNLFELDVNELQKSLINSPKRNATTAKSSVIVSFPNADGKLERYRIFESSNMDPALAAKYPEIKSYVGNGIDNPTSSIYFSTSPLGVQTMAINADKSAVFIEPYTKDLNTYVVYKKSDKVASLSKFECTIIENAKKDLKNNSLLNRPNADDGNLRTFRLAQSVTGEYTTYFGGTKALALAAINNTMTRVNGVFEKDFGVHMNLIANNDLIIYTTASTDPYSASASKANWNQELQTNLTNVIGSANYDIGHLFGGDGGGGNAGCIGCVCKNPSTTVPLGKGSGYTSPGDGIPQGDNFDIDYVAHEMGHQFGGNHTFTHSNEGTGAQMEPGSGSTIMGYAGITALDVQPHSDPFFHAETIQQVTNYVKTTTCQTTTLTGNAVPTASAGLDYTIPKSTPFMLTGAGTDANGDVLTYDWEQMDNGTTAAAPSATKTTGPNFRSYAPSASTVRYFPKMSSVLTGATTTAGTELTVEALSSVARTLNFRLTVRDNHAGGPANNSDDALITVNATAGPFSVSSPNTAVSYVGGSSQTITWNVAGTTANGVNTANVDILLSTDGGNTYPITLLAATPNDGTQAVTIPNTAGTLNRIMVKGTNHIFFDVSNTNFTITTGSSDTVAPSAPTTLAAAGTTATTTNLSWTASTDNVAVTGYDVYQGATLKATVTGTTYAVTGLTASTAYTFSVKAKDAAGNISVSSNAVNVTTSTTSITYCASLGSSTADEKIGKVVLGTISNTSTGTAGYEDFTSLSTNATKGTANTITVTPSWTATAYPEGYAVFIDYNQNGLFTDAGELVWSNAASTTTPVSGSFTIPSTATSGATRMRVSMKYNAIPTACETFPYGQVEDYTINIVAGTPDTTAPTTPAALAASGTTQTTTNLTWTASTDNVAVTGYEVYQGATLKATVTGTTYAVSGLTASTAYTFSVKAKDAAGNISASSNIVNVTTLAVVVSTYCTSQGNSVADEKIGKVVLGTINNTSTGGTGYTDFTSISTNLTLNTANTITITPAWTSTAYSEGYSVWVDYNQDGDFADAGEQVWTKAASTTTPVSGTFTIPATATIGSTRMRVSMKYNAIPTACEAFSYGQVEDYTINIVSGAKQSETSRNTITDIKLYPNPTSSIINVTSVSENATFKVYNLLGQMIINGKLSNGSIDVSNINAGNYILEITDKETTSVKRFIKQ
ncbi:chitodextrinase [Flavobacterium sp. CG_9.10]|uniref:GEVED domain-containing protein n=1 Tax=Flavobacterium sp. CG_9.10 TaxID=2787729 RepID=UPI0018C95182|nr:GEVED domain-containing protein [Flavobacterium sp. CG_9.10]MBG6111826.1 chitodextrinase [Flavobacterium sp. CG_9.10]